MAVYTKVKAMGMGPYIRTSDESIVEITKVDTNAATSSTQMQIFPEYIRFYNVDESPARYTSSRLLSIDSSKKTKTVNADDFVISTDDSVTITNSSGKANLSVVIPDPDPQTNNLSAKSYMSAKVENGASFQVDYNDNDTEAFRYSFLMYAKTYQVNAAGTAYAVSTDLVKNSWWYGFVNGGYSGNPVNAGGYDAYVQTIAKGSAVEIYQGTASGSNDGMRLYYFNQANYLQLKWVDQASSDNDQIRFMITTWKMQPSDPPSLGTP